MVLSQPKPWEKIKVVEPSPTTLTLLRLWTDILDAPDDPNEELRRSAQCKQWRALRHRYDAVVTKIQIQMVQLTEEHTAGDSSPRDIWRLEQRRLDQVLDVWWQFPRKYFGRE